jgi:hypothetical protein
MLSVPGPFSVPPDWNAFTGDPTFALTVTVAPLMRTLPLPVKEVPAFHMCVPPVKSSVAVPVVENVPESVPPPPSANVPDDTLTVPVLVSGICRLAPGELVLALFFNVPEFVNVAPPVPDARLAPVWMSNTPLLVMLAPF